MNILITGATGQLGYDVVKELQKRGVDSLGIGSADLNICDNSAVLSYFQEKKPTAVIHCAAYTAVDKAEDEAEACFLVNETGTRNLAEACKKSGAKLIYLSTDYVFSGEGSHFYEIDEPTAPLGIYGKSKLAGEQAVQTLMDSYFIVRISWAFGINGNNFVKTMLRLGADRAELSVVNDQIGSPSYTPDLAVLLCDMVETTAYGIYHASNEGCCSWAEFAEEIMKQAKFPCKIRGIPSKDYPTKATRPKNSRLSKDSLKVNGFQTLPSWQDGLGRFFLELSGIET